MKVHTILGPGLLESAYQSCLAFELRRRGFSVRTQVALPVVYEGVALGQPFRIDMIVNDLVLVEVKASSGIQPIHVAQLLSYLRLSGYTLGLILNFHEVHLKDGIRRLVSSG